MRQQPIPGRVGNGEIWLTTDRNSTNDNTGKANHIDYYRKELFYKENNCII